MTTDPESQSAAESARRADQRLLAELQALSTRIAVVNEIGIAINRSLNIDDILQVVGQQAKWLLDFEWCSVYLRRHDQETHTIVYTNQSNHSPVVIAQDVFNRVFRTRQQYILRNEALPFRLILVLPLEIEHQVVGTINFATNQKDTYSHEDIRIGYMLALQVAAAVRNAYQFATISELNTKLDQAHQRAEELLLNILPSYVVSELQTKGRFEPIHAPSATVMFVDFVKFVQIAADMSADRVLEELEACFTIFDQITGRHGIDKLKTIGDSYMCVAGILEPDSDHALNTVRAAQEIVTAIHRRKLTKEQHSKEYWNVRIGVNTGPLIAGIIGQHQLAYDVWGDTVNMASRLEQASRPGKINISRTTYDYVREFIPCISRGKLTIKHGHQIEMFFAGEG